MSKYLIAWLNEATGDIHSPKVRMVYPTLLEPKANRKIPGSALKFNVIGLIPKVATFDLMSAEVVRAATEKHGKDWKLKKLRMPLVKTTDEPKLAQYAEEFPYLLKASANADFPPFVYGPDAKRFTGKPQDIYSGRWAVIAGLAWGYDIGSLGVGWNLNRIQLLDHDEVIAGGRVDTAEGFEAVAAADEPTKTSGAVPGGKAVSTDDIFGD